MSDVANLCPGFHVCVVPLQYDRQHEDDFWFGQLPDLRGRLQPGRVQSGLAVLHGRRVCARPRFESSYPVDRRGHLFEKRLFGLFIRTRSDRVCTVGWGGDDGDDGVGGQRLALGYQFGLGRFGEQQQCRFDFASRLDRGRYDRPRPSRCH